MIDEVSDTLGWERKHTGLGGGEGESKTLGDLFVGEFLDIGQDNRFAGLGLP